MSFDALPSNFIKLLSESQMIFEKPEGLVATPILENDHMKYEYALRYPDKRFEVRYAIRPLADQLKEYEEYEKNKKSEEVFIHPNMLYAALFQAVSYNVLIGEYQEMREFVSNQIKQFRADWGATIFGRPHEDFGQDYNYCFILGIHKDNIGDAYYFYLSDTQDDFTELMIPVFQTLYFQ